MIGLVLNKLYENETLIYELQNTNSYIFYADISKPMINNELPLLPINEVFGFKGTLVSTDLYTTNIIRKTINRKIFYVQDMEWVKHEDFFENRVDLYTDPAIVYIAASDEISRGLSAWGTKSQVIKPIEFKKILNV